MNLAIAERWSGRKAGRCEDRRLRADTGLPRPDHERPQERGAGTCALVGVTRPLIGRGVSRLGWCDGSAVP
jgi:hypothetical protein